MRASAPLNVKIPQGFEAGSSIRLTGQGEKPPGVEKADDLYLEVAFSPHRFYRPEGRDPASRPSRRTVGGRTRRERSGARHRQVSWS